MMLSNVKYRTRIFRQIKLYIDSVGVLFCLSALMKISLIAASVALPFIYSVFIEDIILGKQLSLFWVVIVGYIGISLVKTGAGYADLKCNLRIANQLSYKARKRIIDNLFSRDFSSYEKLDLGDMKMTIDSDITKLTDFVKNQTIDYIIQFIKIAVLVNLMFFMEWRLAIFSVVVIPLTFLFDGFIGKKEKQPNADLRKNDKDWDNWLYATTAGWREVRANNAERREERTFFKYTHNDAITFSRWNNYWITRILLFPKIKDEFFMQFCLYLLGGYLIYKNFMTIGVLLVFVQYYAELTTAVKTVSTYEADLKSNQVFYDRVLDELDSVKEQTTENEGKITDISDFDIEFEDVTFRYANGNHDVFDHFNLSIKQGERVAIVGDSGRGKSTLLKLLAGMLKAQSGSISYGGTDIRGLHLPELHKRVGFVMQDSFLFNATIKENLQYGKEDATDENIRDACAKAYISDYIESLPEQYDTVIGEKGLKLSGGQRQRIVLARFFLRDADMFILDEATSALDQYSESMIQHALSSIAKDKTVIIVAHRQSSIALCNRVVRL